MRDTDFESAPQCNPGHVLRNVIWRVLYLRRRLGNAARIVLSKMDVKRGVSAGGGRCGAIPGVWVPVSGPGHRGPTPAVRVAQQPRVLVPFCVRPRTLAQAHIVSVRRCDELRTGSDSTRGR